MSNEGFYQPGSGAPKMSRRPSQDPSARRRRILTACNACRQRKSKCDGLAPVCAMCRAAGTNCQYARTSFNDGGGANLEDVEAMKKRLRTLEGVVMSFNAPQKLHQAVPPIPTQVTPAGDIQSHKTCEPRSRTQADTPPSTVASSNETHHLACAVDATDGMGAICSEPDQRSLFYGPSSNIMLTRIISRMLEWLGNAAHGWSVPIEQDERSYAMANKLHSPESLKMAEPFDEFAIPPDVVVQRLLDHFFSRLGVLWPILHIPSFMEECSRLRDCGGRHMRRSWLALFNMVLALALTSMVQDDSPPDVRAADAQVYYRRAITLCDRTAITCSSLEIVQVLVLTVEYLQATNKAIQTSITHSLAVNAAMRIGLHSSQATQMFPPLEREMRRRTWHVLVVFDRILSMTMGQPMMIPNSLVGTPRFCEQNEPPPPPPLLQSNTGLIGGNETQNLVVFTATVELYNILGTVIDRLYNQNVDVEESPDMLTSITTVWDLDNELQQWEREMPKDNKTVSSSEVGMILDSIDLTAPVLLNRRFQFILTLRYLNLRVLLHRPVLVRFFESTYSPMLDHSEANLLSKLGSQSLLTCFRCSMEIISIVGRVTSEPKPALRYLSAWWFTLYYTFNAALIVFGVMVVCHDSGQKIPHAPIRATCKEGVERAVQALRQMDPGNTIIQRCHDYLQRLLAVSDISTHNSVTSHNTGLGSISDRNGRIGTANSWDTFNPAPLPSGPSWNVRNVGEFMPGDGLGILDSYFPFPDSTVFTTQQSA